MPTQLAHLDESGGHLTNDQRLYVLGAVLSDAADSDELISGVTKLLLPHQDHLHFREERAERRAHVARALADLPVTGAIVVHRSTSNRRQEHARATILRHLLPRLQHSEGVGRAVVESRHLGDQHDHRTIGQLRRSKQIDAQLRIDHVRKRADPRLWVADFLVSAFVAAELNQESAPWKVLDDGFVVDVVDVSDSPEP